MKRYEYQTLDVEVKGFLNKRLDISKVDHGLNALGEQGWELVGVSPLTCAGDAVSVLAFLKREICE